MTWQEELSQLDGALASGQISADDYRRERERILAVATGGITRQSQPSQPAQPVQPNPPGPQGPGQGGPVNRGQDAFPPPFKWTTERPSTPEQTGGEDRTQTVSNPDKTQVVSNAGESTQIVDMNKQGNPQFGERTQVVHPVSPPPGLPVQQPWQQHPPQQQQPGPWGPQQSQPPWEDQDELVSPWAGYQAQGSELFESDKPSGGKGKVFGIIGLVVLLLAIIGGVLYLTVLKKDDTAAPSDPPQQSSQAPSTPDKPDPYGPLYVPEGTTSGGKSYTAVELNKSKALPTPDLLLLKQAGLSEARSVIVVNDSTTISLWSFGTNDPPGLVESINIDQKRFDFGEVPGAAKDGVPVFASQQKSASRTVYVFRAHYTSGGNVIRVEAFDPDQAKAKTQFDEALTAQLELTPPE